MLMSCGRTAKSTTDCIVDSVNKKPTISIEDQLSPTYVYNTNCGKFYSLYYQKYLISDTIHIKNYK